MAKLAKVPAAVAVAEPPLRRYLIAESRQHAANTAEHEWGWVKAKGGWKDHGGHVVTYVASVDALKKITDTVLYQGYRWYSWIAPHLLAQIAKDQRLHLCDKPQP